MSSKQTQRRSCWTAHTYTQKASRQLGFSLPFPFAPFYKQAHEWSAIHRTTKTIAHTHTHIHKKKLLGQGTKKKKRRELTVKPKQQQQKKKKELRVDYHLLPEIHTNMHISRLHSGKTDGQANKKKNYVTRLLLHFFSPPLFSFIQSAASLMFVAHETSRGRVKSQSRVVFREIQGEKKKQHLKSLLALLVKPVAVSCTASSD